MQLEEIIESSFLFVFIEDFELHVVDTAGQDEYSIFPTQYAVDIHG